MKIGETKRSQDDSRTDSSSVENYCAFEELAIVAVLKVKGKSSFSRPIVDVINLINAIDIVIVRVEMELR